MGRECYHGHPNRRGLHPTIEFRNSRPWLTVTGCREQYSRFPSPTEPHYVADTSVRFQLCEIGANTHYTLYTMSARVCGCEHINVYMRKAAFSWMHANLPGCGRSPNLSGSDLYLLPLFSQPYLGHPALSGALQYFSMAQSDISSLIKHSNVNFVHLGDFVQKYY